MRVIDWTSFQNGLTAIAIHDSASVVGQSIIATINDVIELVEPEIMIELFGSDFYDTFLEALEETSPEAKWITLRNLCIKGLKFFVYIEYDSRRQTYSTEAGEMSQIAQNQTNRNTFRKHRTLYNAGVTNLQIVYDYINENIEDYPDYEDLGFEFERINAFNI